MRYAYIYNSSVQRIIFLNRSEQQELFEQLFA
jgi:hypothetical protein